MSYRCTLCKVVCDHSQIRVVTRIRERKWPKNGYEIEREEVVCRDCSADLKVNVPPVSDALSNGQSKDPIDVHT